MRIVLLFLLLPALTFAQTNVSGFISANTTWTLAGSPYIVTGNALLSHGYTLTIEPGVVVKFDTAKALQIDGELIAIGSPSNRITFTSNKAIPAPGDWASIHFPDSCVDAVFDTTENYVSGSIMKYCDVLYGGRLQYAEIHIDDSSPYFTHCRISNSSKSGIYSTSTSTNSSFLFFKIDSSAITNCNDVGLNFFTYSRGLFIVSDTIENNNGGIFVQSNNSSHTTVKKICNNSFISNYGQKVIAIAGTTYNMLVAENFIANNSSDYVMTLPNINNGNLRIECNKILNNQSTGIIFSTYPLGGYISNNIIEGNSSSGPIITQIKSVFGLHFQNNVLRNNSSSTYCFNFGIGSQLFVEHNDFVQNIGTSAVFLNGGSAMGSMRYNNFVNPNCQYEIYNDNSFSPAYIYVDSNYWGGSSIAHIDSVIYDYFDLANKSVVYYLPILAKSVDIDTTCPAFVFPTAINETTGQERKVDVKAYPNPFSNQFTVEFADNAQTTISLFNFLGQQILRQTFTNSTTISTEQLASGIYFYELRNSKGVIANGKVVKH